MPTFTKQAIKASFMKLLNEQPLGRITVRSIVGGRGMPEDALQELHRIISLFDGLHKEIIRRSMEGGA